MKILIILATIVVASISAFGQGGFPASIANSGKIGASVSQITLESGKRMRFVDVAVFVQMYDGSMQEGSLQAIIDNSKELSIVNSRNACPFSDDICYTNVRVALGADGNYYIGSVIGNGSPRYIKKTELPKNGLQDLSLYKSQMSVSK
ncbi:MAG: hypothetical protein OEX08_00260 [Candidatus Nomurabacteria bacterium]|nr:hypothetical protein [Candidatus Nomurabacteria bacterium]